VNDVAEYKKTVDGGFGVPNTFLKDKATLKYVGTKYFGQPRQIGVPVVVNEYHKGEFQTVFVGTVAD
jgi:branched-chain amino acid transport system substrate-binding protein